MTLSTTEANDIAWDLSRFDDAKEDAAAIPLQSFARSAAAPMMSGEDASTVPSSASSGASPFLLNKIRDDGPRDNKEIQQVLPLSSSSTSRSRHDWNEANPGPNDVLCGRGNRVNYHPGNVKFRRFIKRQKLRYLAAWKAEKPSISSSVVEAWRRAQNPPGRFLGWWEGDEGENERSGGGATATEKRDGRRRGRWVDIGDQRALQKAAQCLRERNYEITKAMDAAFGAEETRAILEAIRRRAVTNKGRTVACGITRKCREVLMRNEDCGDLVEYCLDQSEKVFEAMPTEVRLVLERKKKRQQASEKHASPSSKRPSATIIAAGRPGTLDKNLLREEEKSPRLKSASFIADEETAQQKNRPKMLQRQLVSPNPPESAPTQLIESKSRDFLGSLAIMEEQDSIQMRPRASQHQHFHGLQQTFPCPTRKLCEQTLHHVPAPRQTIVAQHHTLDHPRRVLHMPNKPDALHSRLPPRQVSSGSQQLTAVPLQQESDDLLSSNASAHIGIDQKRAFCGGQDAAAIQHTLLSLQLLRAHGSRSTSSLPLPHQPSLPPQDADSLYRRQLLRGNCYSALSSTIEAIGLRQDIDATIAAEEERSRRLLYRVKKAEESKAQFERASAALLLTAAAKAPDKQFLVGGIPRILQFQNAASRGETLPPSKLPGCFPLDPRQSFGHGAFDCRRLRWTEKSAGEGVCPKL